MTLCVAVVAGDPGGASAILPIVRQLLRVGARITLFAYEQAREILSPKHFPASAITTVEILAGASDEWIDCEIANAHPNVVLLGTSVNAFQWEVRFIEACRRLDVPSLSVLDFWSNYGARFSRPGVMNRVFPDVVSVMDETAREALVSEGVPAHRIAVTGQPALDALVARPRSENERRAAIHVLFVSQPLSNFYKISELGFDEDSVLRLVMDALETVHRNGHVLPHLTIRPHPRQDPAGFRLLPSPGYPIVVSGEPDRYAAIHDADLVIGMSSMLLIEAVYLGAAVVSVQPGLRGRNPFPSSVLPLMETVLDAARIRNVLMSLLESPDARQALRSRASRLQTTSSATPKILSILSSLAAQQGSRGLPP